MKEEVRIVFYDGNCGFCNRSAQFVLKRNRRQPLIYFASLQSDFAQNFFQKHNEPLPDLSSLVFFDDNVFYYKSTAGLKIGRYLNRYKIVSTISLRLPKFFRDFVYDLIAKNRNKLSRQVTCVIPTNEDRDRFLGI